MTDTSMLHCQAVYICGLIVAVTDSTSAFRGPQVKFLQMK